VGAKVVGCGVGAGAEVVKLKTGVATSDVCAALCLAGAGAVWLEPSLEFSS